VVLDTGDIDENGNLYYTEARVAANSAVAANTAKVGVIAGGTTGQALVKASGTDYDTEWADIAIDTQYHNRFQTDAETFRSGATDTVELYYTAKADGDGLAESASSDTPTAGKIIRRKIYYSEAAFADPDTGTWVEFTPAPADDASFATVKAALLEYLKARTGGTVPISLKQTWEEVTAAPAFTGLLNETYGSGAEAAYSTRRLNGNVTDCMVIRRASDSTTTTIGFDSEGNIDEAAIETFCTGTTCTLYQWLDQSGNGNTVTAAAPANEPTIYTGGAIVKEGGRLAVEFDGTNDGYILDTSGLDIGSLSSFTVGKFATTANQNMMLALSGNAGNKRWYAPYSTNGNINFGYASSGVAISTPLNTNQNVFTMIAGTTLGGVEAWVSSSYIGTATLTTGIDSTKTGLGNWDGSLYMDGTVQEVIYYASDKSSVRTSIESNIGDYFTQNTPLLDTYSGAAAAYSLRKLSSSYSGSAVEVYNGSSYADIGFDVFGGLNTVALAAHCGSNDGFVSKWYDQAGSNDAVQTTTANMPKIYDGTTGVVTENGKPAVEFDGSNDLLVTANTSINVGTARNDFAVTTLFQNTFWGVFNMDGVGGGRYAQNIRGGANAHTIGFTTSGTAISTVGATTLTLNQQYLFSAELDGTDLNIYVDGTVDGTLTQSSQKTGTSNLAIGTAGGTNSGRIQGYIQEVITYQSNQSSTRTDIESNIATFYEITI
jgi:hypothetical protein